MDSHLLLSVIVFVISLGILAYAIVARSRCFLEGSKIKQQLIKDEQKIKLLTQDLKIANDSLNDIEQMAQVGTWRWNIATNEGYWSDSLYRLLGLKRLGDINIADQLSKNMNQDDKIEADRVIREVISSGKVGIFDFRYNTTDGREIYFRGTCYPMVDDSGKTYGIYGVDQDITELKKLEVELGEAKKNAVKGENAKSQFITNVSHELKTPIYGIIAFTNYGLADCKNDNVSRDAVEDDLLEIKNSAEHLLEVINKLFDLSRLNRGDLTYFKKYNNVNAIIEKLIDRMYAEANIKKANFNFVKSTDVDQAFFDSERISQVFENILDNAIKYCEFNTTIEINKKFSQINLVDYLLFSIENTGPSISKEEIDDIFSPFAHGSKINDASGGLGMGLAIAKMIVNDHGGKIWVKSENSKFSIFFTLPIREVDEYFMKNLA